MMRLELKPLTVFRLGARKVIQCRMIQGRPQDALRRRLIYRDGALCVPLQLTGMSTAWGLEGTYDFTFEGPLEPSVEPSAAAVLAPDLTFDGSLEPPNDPSTEAARRGASWATPS